MIESNTLPPEAVEYLNEVDKPDVDPMIAINRDAAKVELLSFCNDFLAKSKAWRAASYEKKWEKYQRMADGIFEPEIANQKEAWQSRVHVGITASHRESIHAYLFRVMAGTNPPLDIQSRFDLGDIDQSDNIKDIIIREMDKTKWEVELDACLNDANTFGSGFIRRYWKTETATRKLKTDIKEKFTDNLNPMGMIGYAKRAALSQLKTVGYEESEQEVVIYRGLKLQYVPIWDVYKTPKSIKITGSTVAIRYPIVYGDIVKGAKDGYYLPEAVTTLASIGPENKEDSGKSNVNSDREISDANPPTTDYSKELECYELFGKIPKKWLYSIIGQPIDGDPEVLVSSRVIFHKGCLVAVEMNNEYDGEPGLHQLNYFPKTGDSYGRGIPEMLESPQAVINEIVNQRLDNGAMVLNNCFGVVESALVNPKQDLKSKPGQFIRFDVRKVHNGDVRNAIMQMQINDTPLRAGFSEVNEWERFAQERTSANRVTLGTAGLVKDANQTLGGQQMLKEAAGDKFAYIGLLMELAFSQELYHGIWKTVYKNIDPEDIENAIGPERAQSFILITPEEILRDYIYKPMGVFTMENKAIRQARVLQIREAFKGAPWLDDEKMYDEACRAGDIDGDMFKKSEEDILAEQSAMIQPEGQIAPEGPGVAPLEGQPMTPPLPVAANPKQGY